MKEHPVLKYIQLDDFAATPKYQQLAHQIRGAIRAGYLKEEDQLPSINEISYHFEISRDTVEKAYKYLKSLHVLESVPGKGYYVRNAHPDQPYKVLLLLNKLSEHKKIIYDSFARALGSQAEIVCYIYNSDVALFKRLLQAPLEAYSHIVILPHFREQWPGWESFLDVLPLEKVILLDRKSEMQRSVFGVVYEDFETDIYQALEGALERLQKYQTLVLIFPEHSYYPDEIVSGFQSFCQDYAFQSRVTNRVLPEDMQAGQVYINIRERDLIDLLETILQSDLKLGQDIGLITYNETPMKKLLLNGLTTISTNFIQMGHLAAQIILENKPARHQVPFQLNLRASL